VAQRGRLQDGGHFVYLNLYKMKMGSSIGCYNAVKVFINQFDD